MIKSYYRASIKENKNTAIASDDEQMFSNEKKFSNNHKKIIDQFSEFQDTKISVTTLDTIIFGANASNATAFNVFNRAKSEKNFQSSSSIKRDQNCFRKRSIIQLKNQSNLSIFLLNKIDFSILSFRIPYAKSRRKEINDLLNKKIFDVMILTDVFSKVRLFNFYFVDEIKNLNISATFKKSRLMIQTFNNRKKK